MAGEGPNDRRRYQKSRLAERPMRPCGPLSGVARRSRFGLHELPFLDGVLIACIVLLSWLVPSGFVWAGDAVGPLVPPWLRPTIGPSMSVPPMVTRGEDVVRETQRSFLTGDAPSSDTIDRVSGEEKGPRIPDPMVFDLVRPLGAKRGEGEINVLGLIPLRRTSRAVDDASDPLGLVRRSPDTQGIEWAPEIEYVLRDDLAVEFELPMENGCVEAYKGAGQVTFGTALDYQFIHGAQVIVQYDRDPKLWTTTFLYLAGFRFNETWSVFGMFGPRAELGGRVVDRRTEWLSNVTLFADVTHRLVAGIETNFGQVIDGHASWLIMPQLHYEVSKRWMIQGGVGTRITKDLTLPEVGFRLIREF